MSKDASHENTTSRYVIPSTKAAMETNFIKNDALYFDLINNMQNTTAIPNKGIPGKQSRFKEKIIEFLLGCRF